MGVEFSELVKFNEELKRLCEKKNIDMLIEQCANTIAAEFLSRVKKKTPVGMSLYTDLIAWRRNKDGAKPAKDKYGNAKVKAAVVHTGGTLRRGWNISPAVTRVHISSAEIYNNVFYAAYVEYGHRQTPGRYVPAIGKRLKKSWVDGKFMMTKTAEEMEKLSLRYVEKAVNEYIRGILR